MQAGTPRYRFLHITGKDGLPHQQIEALMQDDKGMMWIGTKNGLSRYDGYEMITYYHDANNSRSLKHNFIKSIFQDKHGRIWVGTYKGICRYLPESDDFQQYSYPDNSIFKFDETNDGTLICCNGNNVLEFNEKNQNFVPLDEQNGDIILSIAADKHNRIFISTNKNIRYYDIKRQISIQLDHNIFKGFLTNQGSDNIVPLFVDSKGFLWIGRNGKGTMRLDTDLGDYKMWESTVLSDGTVRVFEEDEYGRIWIGTEKGITIIDKEDKIEIIQQNFINKYALNDNAVYSIIRDWDENIWIGTYFGGINVLLKSFEKFEYIEAGYGNQDLKGKVVRKILEPQNNNLWIATEDGGLNILNTLTGIIEQPKQIQSLSSNIHELLYDEKKDEMWIGTFRSGLLKYDLRQKQVKRFLQKDNTGLPSDAIFTMVQDNMHRIWIGTTQGLRYLDPDMNKFLKLNHSVLDNDFIYSLLIDSESNLWIGTRNSGLFKYNFTSRNIIHWSMNDKKNSLTDNYITTLYEDSEHRIWIGTNNGGLQFIENNKLNIEFLNHSLYLRDKTICGILEDKLSRLWVSTNVGLFCINADRIAIVRYTIDEGLPVNQFNFSSCLKDHNGFFYFGTINGLICFDPLKTSEQTDVLNVHLTELSIDNHKINVSTNHSPLEKSIDDTESIKLSHSQARSFSIGYAAISLGHTSNINYAVKLDGFDKVWNMVGKNRQISFSRLPSGKYTLMIKAFNSVTDLEKAPVKELDIIILPPFYLTFWAFLIYLIFLVCIMYFGLRLFSIRVKEKNLVKLANMENEKIKEINQLKIDFFTTISHELKTPLSLIIAPLRYLSNDKSLSSDSMKQLHWIEKNTSKMVDLIEELITFNKIEVGQMKLYVQKGNPLEFIDNISELFRNNFNNKSICYNVNIENNGEEVWFSSSFVEKVVNNLLSNAYKFTPSDGKVWLNASIVENEEDGLMYLKVEVNDTGIGIIENEQKNIFENYYQTKRGYNSNPQGWGIGLALCKKLVLLHKGSISVSSQQGQGSSFRALFNVSEEVFCAESKTSQEAGDNIINNYKYSASFDNYNGLFTPPEKNSLKIKPKTSTILVVDDNEDFLQFLLNMFFLKYNVLQARNGVEALETTRKNLPDLIISDIMMPEMDGIEFCRIVKTDILTSHIPIILLTAKSGHQNLIIGYENGADVYIEKPFDPQALELQVNNIIKLKKQVISEIANNFGENINAISLNSRDEEFINKLNEVINKNISNEYFSISDVTREMGVSRTVLHVKMKNLLGISLGEYIKKKRLRVACELLLQGFNISEVSYQTGFAEHSYFSRCFKKEFKLTPTNFVSKHNKNE
jgi:ligand-binding sensor domain-containing protein/signal transduction histidine kinase/CheY-like chemotaxis protein